MWHNDTIINIITRSMASKQNRARSRCENWIERATIKIIKDVKKKVSMFKGIELRYEIHLWFTRPVLYLSY